MGRGANLGPFCLIHHRFFAEIGLASPVLFSDNL
jgi:hypothetical protein